jgi:hypothetical protein
MIEQVAQVVAAIGNVDFRRRQIAGGEAIAAGEVGGSNFVSA